MSIMELLLPAAVLFAIGGVFGIVLTIALKKLHVPKDEKTELIASLLPGANCGACGEAGCAAYAARLASGGAPVNLCPVGGKDLAVRLAEVMGVSAGEVIERVARIHCQGGHAETSVKFEYSGPLSCAAAAMLNGGFKSCSDGCLGLGDCTRVCQFDAIVMGDNGLPVVDPEKCTACGMCVSACPKHIISLIEKSRDIYVKCSNHDRGPVMKQGCKVGCIACNLCNVKACKLVFADNPDIETAIDLDNNLAVIDYALCIDCGRCATVCPQKVITFKKAAASETA